MRQGKSVVVVGARPGGLAAALLLARGGKRVTVLERQARVGGRTSTLTAYLFWGTFATALDCTIWRLNG
jgi:phytoene dehydrogenase-like protein